MAKVNVVTALMSRLLGAPLAVTIVVLVSAGPALAGGPYPGGEAGYDISWPQCDQAYPDLVSGDLAVVGVTGGRPFKPNPCLRSEFGWGMLTGRTPGLYINVAFGLTSQGPLRCGADNDRCRAYDYGYLTAQYAYTYAHLNSLGRALDSPVWWLDVETANLWSSDQRLNARVVEGAEDFLRRGRVARVGVYSTPRQWRIIAGRGAPQGVPNWVAGAEGADDVSKCLSPLWDGGQVWLIQYLIGDYDQIRSC
jgi:hypothetical protein